MKFLLPILLALAAFVAAEASPDPEPDNLWAGINGAAQAAKASQVQNAKKPGAQPSPAKAPKKAGPNYGAQCQKKNGALHGAIAGFCSRQGDGVTVPSDWASTGFGVDIVRSGVLQATDKKSIYWCAKIGSKKKKCGATKVPKAKCLNKLYQVCAKGDAKGTGKAKDGECFIYETGKLDYNKEDVIHHGPFWQFDKDVNH